MALDSLGLGLTLDTTLLEKADKTLENMHKNSKLIMQNLTRGFTAFSEGKIGDFTKVFENMSKAMDKISNTTVSLDFDTSGLQKGLGYISQLTTEIEKMQRKGAKQFFNPNELYTTTESTTEVSSRLNKLYSLAEALGQVLKVLSEYPQKIREAENEVAKIDSLLKRTKAGSEKNTLYSQQKHDVETALKKMRDELAESKRQFGDLDAARLAERGLKEEIKITQQQLAWTQKTKAEQLAAITSYNNKIIADEKARTKEVETLYRNNFAEMQKISKAITQLEADKEKIAKGGGDTSEQDANLAFYRDQLQKRIELEEEITRSGYQKIAKIKEELNAKAFLNSSKQQVKDLQTDVAFANQFSKNAKNVEEEKQAIELLRSARNNLSKDTAHYSQIVEALNKRILSHKDHIEAVTREEKEQNTLADSVINRYRKQLKELDELNEALDELAKKQQSTGALYNAEEMRARIDLTDRRDTVQKDILEIEKNAQGQLDVIREQHDAERAKKKVDSILKQNEREKQEYAKLLDDLYAIEKQKKAMEAEGGGVGDAAYDNLLQQEADLNARKSQLEARHQNDLDEIRKNHNKKRNDDEVKAFIEAQKEKQKIAEETQKKIDAYNEKYGTTSKRNAEIAITSFSGAQNINQHKQAIEGLQQVRARLDNTDKEYYQTLKKLNQEIHSHELFIRAAENESVRLGNSHRGLMDISGQLMRRLALVFSVSQMTQYFRKLVEVRGQFEKTEVALTSIIQSQEKANKLMNQTIALAIKSPFTLQQLTGYTKQLAAYQVEYKDLYNTTKMLADVSAGLGVEMDRLILAFGQVKAANYLRATEVRQFTEAGFNILGELAKYYSELEGTMVSVGDVQERVTKRMVDFADVEEIFHRVTEAGGMFYEMQSKQAETLAGQWTNLQDRIDVMLNEIGTSGDGVLKFIVKMLASAIDNWEVLASSIKTAATAFIIFKTYSLLAGDGMKLLAIQMGVLTDTVPKVLSLGQAFKTLGKVVGSAVTKIGASMGALLTNPIFLAVAAIGALISAGFSLYRHFDKMKDALKEQSDSFNEYTSSLSKLSREFGKLDKFTEKLAKLEELKGRLNERGLALSVKIDEVDAENIDKIFAENSEILQKSYDLGLSVGNAITRGLNAAQGNIFGWSLFGENLAEDAEDFAGKWNKLASYGMDAQMTAMTNEIEATIAAMNDMTEEERSAYAEMLKIYEKIKDGRKAEKDDKGKIIKYTESEYEWTIRRATALKQIQDLEDGSVTKNDKLTRYLRQVARQERELNNEVENTVNKLAKEFGGLEELMKKAQENPVEFSAAIQAEIDKQAWDEVTKWVYSQKLHARLDIEPNYVEDPSRTDSEKLAQFQQDLMSARTNLKGVKDGYQNFFISEEEIKNMKFFSDGLEGVQKLYDDNKKTIEQLEGTKSAYNKEEMARLDALQKELRAVAKLWGYDLDLNAKGGESEALKNLKDQIKLIRDANKAYEERNKKFGKDASKSVVTDSYKDAFKEVELAIEDIDYTNLEGVVEALETLEDEAKKAGGTTELLKAISEVKAEIGLTLKDKQDRELFDQVQEIFDQYELAVDIKKLNIPLELAKNLFGVDTKSFDQMRTEIISKFAGTNAEVSKILSKGSVMSAEDEQKLIDLIGKERVEEAKKAIEKIDDLEEKQQLERLKKYVEYAKKGVSERAKIKLEEMKRLEEIQETFEVKEGDSADVKAQKEDMAKRASENVRKESQEALNKLDWAEFEKSDMFIQVFDDLDNASTSLLSHLIEKIQGFKDAWTDMPLEDVEKIIDALNKLQTRLAESAPWKEFKKAKEDLENAKKAVKFEDAEAKELSEKGGRGDYMAALDKEDIAQQNILDAANKQIAALEVQLSTQEKIVATTDAEKAAKAASIAETTKELDRQKGIKAAAEGNLKNTQKVRSEQRRVNTALAAQYQTTSKCFEMAVELGTAVKDLVETLSDDDPAAVFAEMGLNMLSTVANTLALQAQLIAARTEATGLGLAMNTAAGVIGWIVMAIQLLVTAISAAVNYAEKMRQMKLDILADQVDNLKQKYDALAESIDKAYSTKQLQEYSKEIEKVQAKMEDAQRDYIKLLESGKDGDTIDIAKEAQRKLDDGLSVDDLSKKERKALLSEEYQDYKEATEALAEMQKDHEEQKQDMLDSMGGVTDYKSAAQEFVDAWVDAFQETGDGLSGLQENFREFFDNVIKQEAMRRVTDKYMQPFFDDLNAALESESSLSEGEIADLKAKADKVAPELSKVLEELWTALGGSGGETSGGLSALQKGLSGMSEQQAEILTAYWNSVRGYTASIDSKMDLILANMGVGAENNPMLDQLIAQTSVLNNIYSFLQNMTTSAPAVSQFSGRVWKSSM